MFGMTIWLYPNFVVNFGSIFPFFAEAPLTLPRRLLVCVISFV